MSQYFFTTWIKSTYIFKCPVKFHNLAFFLWTYSRNDKLLFVYSEPQGISFIETSNLDGETNLKIRQAHPDTSRLDNTLALTDFSATVQCEQPNRHLYEFNGMLKELNSKSVHTY